MNASFADFARRWHPFDALEAEVLALLAGQVTLRRVEAGTAIYAAGDAVPVFSTIAQGTVDLVSREGMLISRLHEGDYFGALALLGDGKSVHRVEAASDAVLYEMPAAIFRKLLGEHRVINAFFNRSRKRQVQAGPGGASSDGWLSMPVSELMSAPPLSCPPQTPLRESAALMDRHGFSCILVVSADDRLEGILTTRDITRLMAGECAGSTPVSEVMTRNPRSLTPEKTGFDAILAMSDESFGHLPVVREGRPVGILTQTDLVRRHSVSAIHMIRDLARCEAHDDLARVLAGTPALLAHLVGSGVPAHQIGHMITSVTDALTRRLISLAIERLGPAPVGWLWLACGSQGRREQTGISDQDNCLILSDEYDEKQHGAWFEDFARHVSDGLNAAGYIYCPGDMMATNPRWRQPLSVWKSYFERWIRVPEPMAQMLASVMFDLRPIDGDFSLHSGLQAETLAMARSDSIFRSHMIANSLKHYPPLGLFRGFALIRGGEHKDRIDLKHSGTVPVVDLARVYALQGAIEQVNTRERLMEAVKRGVLSSSGGADLLDAFDLISTIRLQHQARLVREGEAPDNFLMPSSLSALERNHLKDAFSVVKSLQSSIGHGLI